MQSQHTTEVVRFKSLGILGYPNYRVSNDGQVWSSWEQWRGGEWRLLKQKSLDDRGYKIIHLYDGKGGGRKYLVHHLVLSAFVGPCPEGMEGCHFPDRDPSNNRLENLRWGTHTTNMQDAVVHGTTNRGRKHPLVQLTEAQVRRIRELWFSGRVWNKCELGRMFGVSDSTIYMIVKGKRWAWLP